MGTPGDRDDSDCSRPFGRLEEDSRTLFGRMGRDVPRHAGEDSRQAETVAVENEVQEEGQAKKNVLTRCFFELEFCGNTMRDNFPNAGNKLRPMDIPKN